MGELHREVTGADGHRYTIVGKANLSTREEAITALAEFAAEVESGRLLEEEPRGQLWLTDSSPHRQRRGNVEGIFVRGLTRAWLLAPIFLITGMGLLWWASQQWLEIRSITSAELAIPAGRVALWLVTIVMAGIVFGLAVASARRDSGRGRVEILAMLALVPMAVLIQFIAWALGWRTSPMPFNINQFLLSETTIIASALVLGLLLSGMIGSGNEKGQEE